MQGMQVKVEHNLHTNVCKVGVVHEVSVWKWPTFLRSLNEKGYSRGQRLLFFGSIAEVQGCH